VAVIKEEVMVMAMWGVRGVVVEASRVVGMKMVVEEVI
jgi:hypothetical protein